MYQCFFSPLGHLTNHIYLCYNVLMNIKTIKNLILLSALGIVFISANNALAYVPGVWDPQPRINTGESAFTKIPNPYEATPIIQRTTVISNKTVANTSTETVKDVSSTTNKTSTNTTVKNKTATNTTANSGSVNSNKLLPIINTDTNRNNLTALSMGGSGGFMPSSVWQWLIVVILILFIIIIARRLRNEPIAQHQDIHPAPAR